MSKFKEDPIFSRTFSDKVEKICKKLLVQCN